jgi:hypothetical protein
MTQIRLIDNLISEIEILRVLEIDTVCRLYRVYEDELTVFLVIDYVQGETILEMVIREHRLSEAATAEVGR